MPILAGRYSGCALSKSSHDDWLVRSNRFCTDLTCTNLMQFTAIWRQANVLNKSSSILTLIQPSNILFDTENRLKLCDFGTITNRKMDCHRENLIERTRDCGTQMYMAPEQVPIFWESSLHFAYSLIDRPLKEKWQKPKTYKVRKKTAFVIPERLYTGVYGEGRHFRPWANSHSDVSCNDQRWSRKGIQWHFFCCHYSYITFNFSLGLQRLQKRTG